MELMGDPQSSYRSIRIDGTNGKTTTARILERILREAGLRTGRTTSPHLRSPVERIAIDGASIDEEGFVQAYRDVEPFAAVVDAEQEAAGRSEEHTSELQSRGHLVCRLLLEK